MKLLRPLLHLTNRDHSINTCCQDDPSNERQSTTFFPSSISKEISASIGVKNTFKQQNNRAKGKDKGNSAYGQEQPQNECHIIHPLFFSQYTISRKEVARG